MEAESMVHALEQVHSLLKSGGHLIDIHPNGEPVEFIYPFEGREYLIGYMQESDDYIEYQQADEALNEAVSKGQFQAEMSEQFTFNTHAHKFDELKTFLDENWSDAIVSEEVIANAKKLEWDYGQRAVHLREKVRMRVYKAIRQN
jgi:hypothetical protein